MDYPFFAWFFSELPGFLMTPPISWFFGLGVCLVVVRFLRSIFHLV